MAINGDFLLRFKTALQYEILKKYQMKGDFTNYSFKSSLHL